VLCVSMHVLFLVRKFLLYAIAFAPGKLQVILKIADQSRAGSHFNSQNTHSQFRNSQLAFYPCPSSLMMEIESTAIPSAVLKTSFVMSIAVIAALQY